MNHVKPQEPLERVEIPIPVQERMSLAEAKCGNQTVDGLADGVPLPAEIAEISGRGDSQLFTAGLEHFEPAKFPQGSCEGLLLADTLKNLAEDQVRQSQSLPAELTVKKVGLVILPPTEIVNPHGGVHDQHGSLVQQASQARSVEVSFPPDFAPKATNGGLRPGAYEQAQSGLNSGSFRARPAAAHGLPHQAVVDIDIRPHALTSYV
jgi:hypothetical protein